MEPTTCPGTRPVGPPITFPGFPGIDPPVTPIFPPPVVTPPIVAPPVVTPPIPPVVTPPVVTPPVIIPTPPVTPPAPDPGNVSVKRLRFVVQVPAQMPQAESGPIPDPSPMYQGVSINANVFAPYFGPAVVNGGTKVGNMWPAAPTQPVRIASPASELSS